jgi:hypothetical protein
MESLKFKTTLIELTDLFEKIGALGVLAFVCFIIFLFIPEYFGKKKSINGFKEATSYLFSGAALIFSWVVGLSLWITGMVIVRYYFHVDYWFPLPPYGELGERETFHPLIEWFLEFYAGR